MSSSKRLPYLVCCGTSGRAVIFGWSATEPEQGRPCRLEDARMVLRWSSGCGGLFGLAAKGPKDGTRLTEAVAWTVTDEAKQILPVTDEAAAALRAWAAV